ncbi:polysaccharide deacetylase family protein [Rhizohabitans arisaemae]|uniref:polysaccharide deacetylase family protein n=1 Tax=Rhizohabitans arisaemae TaxID=2720610 RepID=UPI0024B0D27E|nr:polysaccharide deacetylase family protein [Rhizohabitans arisaemae]
MKRLIAAAIGLIVPLVVATPTTAAHTARAVARPDCRLVACIALTFDDGPGPLTDSLLDTLKRHDAEATFFVVGRKVVLQPETVRRIAAAGHEIGNHSFSHARLTSLPDSAIRDELADTQHVIEQATGRKPRIMRPPYGATDHRVSLISADLGLAQVIWNATSKDWKTRSRQAIIDRTLKHARPDGVVLMHDTVPATVFALPTILRTLKQRGYHLVTVSHLLGRGLRPGEIYPPSFEFIPPEESDRLRLQASPHR